MSICKACGADIIWIKVISSGKAMPLDPSPTDAGNVAARKIFDTDDWIGYVISAAQPPKVNYGRYMPHHATCPNWKTNRTNISRRNDHE